MVSTMDDTKVVQLVYSRWARSARLRRRTL